MSAKNVHWFWTIGTNPQFGCLCQPQLHSKHICTVYLQFALLRIEHEREQDLAPTVQPPDMLLTLAEQIETLAVEWTSEAPVQEAPSEIFSHN